MYRPAQFREDRKPILAAAIKELQFASLITFTGQQLLASHIPVLLKGEEGSFRLEGHVARGNPQWKQLDRSIEALALFVGPHSYVSPSWYATKNKHQRVVPTWNYISVHVNGPLSVIDDPQWLLRHVKELTDHNELDRDMPWSIDDAPREFIEQLCGGIVGFSMEVRQMEGTWKMAQHKSKADRMGVIHGLRLSDSDSSQSVASVMTRLEEERL